MYNKCCVVSCASRRQDISFHQFPKSEKGLRKWLQCINCKILQSMSFQELRKSFVCRNHFEKRFLALKRDRARLRTGAYPTLFTPSEISSNFPQKSFLDKTEIASMNLAAEHSYPRKRHYDHTYGKQPLLESHRRQNLKTTDCFSTSLHKFPNPSRDPSYFNLWVKAIGGSILELDNDHIFKYRRVCHIHFKQDYQCRNNRISRNAMPTLYMTENVNPLIDHPYSRKWHCDHTYATEEPLKETIASGSSVLQNVPAQTAQSTESSGGQYDHNDHNYTKTEDDEKIEKNPVVVYEYPVHHFYATPPNYVYADVPASSFLNAVEAIPQTSAEQAFNQLENYEVETLDYTLLETSGDDNYEGAADSDSDTNSEASHSALRNQKQFEGLEDREIETTSVDQLNVDGQPLDINTVPEQEPPSWSSVKDVCRACLSKSGAWDLTETYLSEDGENGRLLDMLTLCYGIRLSNVSECSASRFLCDVCAASLRHADSFRRQVRRAEGSFADYYGAGDQEIKEECSDEDEGHEKEVSCINKPTESMELDILPSRHISELPSNLKVYHRKRTKPSVEGSTKTAPQNNSMSELSYSDKYIRVISYSANKNVENGSADKEINIESQTAEEFKNVEETNNASHCDEDLLYSDIKRRKNGQDHQNTLSTPKNSKNVPQTPEKDSSHLKQLLERHIPDENAMTFHPLSKTNPKAVKRKNSSATNVTDIDLNFTSIVTQPENNVQQSDGSDSIDFSQSVALTLPGNKVLRFLPS